MRRRLTPLGLALLVAACAWAPRPGLAQAQIEIPDATRELYQLHLAILEPADEATRTKTGEARLHLYTPIWIPPDQEGEPAVHAFLMTQDGGAFELYESHAPGLVMAQQPGGALARIMNLPPDAAPHFFQHSSDWARTPSAVCAPDGPRAIGYYQSPDGAVTITAFRSGFPRADDVCDRLHYRLAP